MIPPLSLVTLVTVLIDADTAGAEPRHERQGFSVGTDSGVGGAVLEFDQGDRSHKYDELEGGVLAQGLGYDWMINEHFAIGLSIDSRGAAIDDLDGFAARLSGRAATRCWTLLLTRIYECLSLLCPHCGTLMRIIASVLDPPQGEWLPAAPTMASSTKTPVRTSGPIWTRRRAGASFW